VAIAIGMLASSLAFTPDWIMMRTIGTVNTSTKPAPSSVPPDSRRLAEVGPLHAVQEHGDQADEDQDAAGQVQRLEATADAGFAEDVLGVPGHGGQAFLNAGTVRLSTRMPASIR
jgi:hypothetical protein